MLHRLLSLFIITFLLGFVALNFNEIKLDLAYGLQLVKENPSCCSKEEVLNATGKFDETANLAVFDSNLIDYPKTSLAYSYSQQQDVLGTTNSAGEEKWIEVSLPEQKLRAWEGSKVVMEFPISSGLKWWPTPTGNFTIEYKTRYQTMKGGSKLLGTYYYLPNVPNNMFFGNDELPWWKGYAIHGAYWHNDFGKPKSHGCVNSPLADAQAIFSWAGPVVPEGKGFVKASPENPGTRVYIH